MAHQLSFKHLIRYDPGEAGVTVDVVLKLFNRNVSFAAKVNDPWFEYSAGPDLRLEWRRGGLDLVDLPSR